MFFKSAFSQYFNSEHVTDDIYLCDSGWESCAPGHSCVGLIRDYYLLHFIASGRGVFHTGDNKYELDEGKGFLICPEEITEYYADRDKPWEYCWFGIKGKKAWDLLLKAGFGNEKKTFDIPDISLIRSVENLHSAIMDSQNPSIMGAGHAIIVLSKLIEAMGDSKNNTSERDYISQTASYIDYNYHRDIKVAELARMVSLNRSHFYRIFHEEMGMAPQEYIINCRLTNAKRLLLTTRLSVSDVAAAVGYQDNVNFSKAFKKRFGIPPGNFRNS